MCAFHFKSFYEKIVFVRSSISCFKKAPLLGYGTRIEHMLLKNKACFTFHNEKNI